MQLEKNRGEIMAKQRKFNFGAVDRTLIMNEEIKTEKEESDESRKAEKTFVTEQLGRMERMTDYKKAFNFKLVPRKKIVFHKENDFPKEQIEERAESILELGLIHNLEALYDEEQDVYIIESGEKRTRAIDLLIKRYSSYTGNPEAEDYKNYLKNVKQFEVEGYPINVKYFDPSEYDLDENSESADELKQIDSKIRVNRANIDVLVLDSVLIRKKIAENSELYKRRNALVKREDRVNINKTIAEELHITERQVQKYKAISTLIPELQEIFDKKGITVNEGAGYANLDETDQRQLLALLKSGEDKTEVNVLYEQLNYQKKQIEASQKEVQRLEKEKEEIEKAVEKERAVAVQLEEKIRAEVAKEHQEQDAEGRKYIKELKEELAKAEENIEQYQRKTENLEKEQQKKVADLELKLKKKETEILVLPTETVRLALKLDGILESMESLMVQFTKTLEKYEHIFNKETGEIEPKEYKDKLQKMLKR